MSLKQALIRVYVALAAIDLLLIGVNALMNAGFHWPFEVLDDQLDLRGEGNVAAWYSSAQLLLVAAAALAAAWIVPAGRGVLGHRVVWCGASAIALALSADETSQLHEWAGLRYESTFSAQSAVAATVGLSGVYLWLLVLAPLIAIAAIWLLYIAIRILHAHPKSMWLTLGGLACWLFTIGAEYIENHFFNYQLHIAQGQQATLEEGSELIGAALLFLAFAEYARNQAERRALRELLDVDGPTVAISVRGIGVGTARPPMAARLATEAAPPPGTVTIRASTALAN